MSRDLASIKLEKCRQRLHQYTAVEHYDPNDIEYQRLKVEEMNCQQDLRLWDQLLERAKDKSDFDGISYLMMFTSSVHGWQSKLSFGDRDNSAQSNFKSQLLDINNGRQPGNPDRIWCPIIQRWEARDSSRAAHIFPVKHGEIAMQAIFGIQGEMFSSLNGLTMSGEAEERFDKGFFAIIPDLDCLADAESVLEWQKRRHKTFKIKVFDFQAPEMNYVLNSDSDELRGRLWKDLDGTTVALRSPAHPRLRYLYFHYLYCLHMRAQKIKLHDQHSQRTEELDSRCWASQGPYIEDRYIRGFANHFGHDTHILTKNTSESIDDEAEIPKYSLNEVFTKQAHYAFVEDPTEDSKGSEGSESEGSMRLFEENGYAEDEQQLKDIADPFHDSICD